MPKDDASFDNARTISHAYGWKVRGKRSALMGVTHNWGLGYE